ncbi:MAG: hypothetical protein MGG37_17220 [Trichodesmium sp. MAG_R01]|nr:hypothetical protein [Trichodesmium sp. MAG_R01]
MKVVSVEGSFSRVYLQDNSNQRLCVLGRYWALLPQPNLQILLSFFSLISFVII